MGEGPNRGGNSRRWIIQEVENSLRRLDTDWIDLYQVHRPEPGTDVDETLGALSDLIHAGKIRYAGSSAFPAEMIVEAQWTAERRGRERFVCEQSPYSILARGIEAGVLPTCERYGMGAVTYSPLAGGWLSGRYRKGAGSPDSARAELMPERFQMKTRHDAELPRNREKLQAAEDLAVLAEEAGISLVEMSIAFALEHPAVTAPIIGPRTVEQLQGQLRGAEVKLSADVLDRIDEIVPPGTTFNVGDAGWRPPALLPENRRRQAERG
jgi:aryl-alcohol dehydrogenase-like predicted oxidoreductase